VLQIPALKPPPCFSLDKGSAFLHLVSWGCDPDSVPGKYLRLGGRIEYFDFEVKPPPLPPPMFSGLSEYLKSLDIMGLMRLASVVYGHKM